MKKKPQRTCLICKQLLPATAHGNRDVHVECEKVREKWSNFFNYARIKEIRKTAIELEEILEINFPHSTGKTPIATKILQAAKFRWDFICRITMSKEGIPIFWILYYGYSFVDNTKQQLIIYTDL